MSEDLPGSSHRGLHAGSGELLAKAHPATLLAYAWARVAAAQARRGWRAGSDGPTILSPPGLPDGARRGMLAALRRGQATCLIEATVRQAWERAHGRDRALVIGVTAPSAGFQAHAWLDGDPPCCSGGFTELTRR